MKRKLIGVFLALFFVSLGYLLWSYKFWPFATASNIPAFVGTTFKMSVPEARRALKKNNIKLVNYETFKIINKILGDKESFWWEQYAVSESEIFPGNIKLIDHESLFMPAISMFNSQVVAEFNFANNQLNSVYVIIFPLSNDDAANVVQNITTQLQKKYTYLSKNHSKEIPGAYETIYGDDVCRLNFRVDLSNYKDPIITIDIKSNGMTVLNNKNNNEELAFDTK